MDTLCEWEHPRASRVALLLNDERATEAVLSFLRGTKVGQIFTIPLRGDERAGGRARKERRGQRKQRTRRGGGGGPFLDIVYCLFVLYSRATLRIGFEGFSWFLWFVLFCLSLGPMGRRTPRGFAEDCRVETGIWTRKKGR